MGNLNRPTQVKKVIIRDNNMQKPIPSQNNKKKK